MEKLKFKKMKSIAISHSDNYQCGLGALLMPITVLSLGVDVIVLSNEKLYGNEFQLC